MSFIYHNYHKHTYYSNLRTLDCVTSQEAYIKRAVELGHTTYFTTEHGMSSNIYEARTLCDKYGIKPIFAVEAYYVDDIYAKEKNRGNSHIMIIALTNNARKHINRIMSIANLEGFYYKPRVDLKLLLSLPKDEVVITTACVASRIFKPEGLKNFMFPLVEYFGKNFFLEVQPHNQRIQIEHNQKILYLSEKYDISIIHANDSHYIYPEDAKYRDLFLKAKGIFYEEEDGFILDYPDSDTILDRYEKQGVLTREQSLTALKNTLVLDKAEEIILDKEFKIPKITNNPDAKLKKLISDSWQIEKNNVPKERWDEYKEAIIYEYNIIKKCGMAEYFIIDHDIVKRAIEEYNGVITRTGRGSGCSFYLNKLLGLTEIDRLNTPIPLYPTRFMSAERILETRSLPDIDINVADQEPFLKASRDILGEDNVYFMVAYKPLQESSAFRLWCKVHEYNYEEYNEVGKDLDEYRDHPKWGQVIKDSSVWVGVIESISPSPCSFLMLDKPISEEIGLMRVGKDTGEGYEICCNLDGYNCDVYKYLKNDFLQVTVWDIIDKVYAKIGRRIDKIPRLVELINKDNLTWDMYSKGLTATLNQMDSDYATNLVQKYKPKSWGELSAMVASIRPGFSSLLNNFIERKPYTNGVPELDKLLESSFHYMMYQENVMQYLIWLGIEEKISYDILKKISKKKFKEQELIDLKKQLLEGWHRVVGKEDGFEETWRVVELNSKYSFNSSHSASVAMDSMYGAYLKSHYPLEYYEVVLNIYTDDIKKISKVTNELPYFGITINPIRFGKSSAGYTMDKSTNSIYKGIASIKYLNSKIADELFDLYNNNTYTNFIDLLADIKTKTSVNSKQLTILITLDFFSDFGKNQYLLKIVDIYDAFMNIAILNKNKIEEYSEDFGLTMSIIEENSGKETKAQFRELNNKGIVDALISNLEHVAIPVTVQIESEKEYLGYVVYTNPEMKYDKYIVTEFKTYKDKTRPYITLRNLKTGEETTTRITSSKVFTSNPFDLFSILDNLNFVSRYKSTLVNGEWVKTDDKEFVLESYDVIKV